MQGAAREVLPAALAAHAEKDTLRFITCGSVDDGKSTLIGRLLLESSSIFDDQLRALEADSRKFGTQGERIDYALLLDGLQAEREQGITIDVAYRFFASARRRFIVADTPGHEQYTRNMATGASTADGALILVDARKGVLVQTRRHTRIAAMMGIRHVALAVNKMDLVGYDGAVFERIAADFRAFAAGLGFERIEAIPVSALEGDNIVSRSARMAWYGGPTVMAYLDTVDSRPPARPEALRLPVQWVNRPSADFRGYCGRIAEGQVAPGDLVRVLPAGGHARIAEVICGRQSVQRAHRGDSVTVTLAEEVDVSRGDMIVAAAGSPQVADQFEARLLWMGEHPLSPGRPYLFKLHAREATATVTAIRHREDIDTGAKLAARSLRLNEIGMVNLAEVSRLMVDAGLIVIVSFISPFRDERALARQLFDPGEFLEVFIDTPLAECERRDPKGLYAKARRGELRNFTGIDSVYERPEAPEVCIDTTKLTPAASAELIIERLGREQPSDSTGRG